MNPAYMLRQTMEKYESLYGVRGHITSLKYYRPETAPDEWEKSALQEFERGAKEISEFTEMDGKLYYRYMSTITVKKGCLKCHGHQEYKVGDVRGGVSVSVPMTPYLINQQRQTITLAVSLGLLWLLGFTGLVWAKRGLKNRARERDRAETELQKSHDRLEQRVEERTTELTHEIEERKQAEEVLEKSEAFLDAMGQMAKVGGWEVDAETHEVRWTAETYRIHEIPQGSKPTLDEAINFFHPEDRPELERAIKRALEHGEPYDMEIRFITARGKHLWTHTNCKPHVVDGRTVKLTGTFQDITEQKRNEEALRESEERYRRIFENIQDIYCEASMDGTILEISPSIENLSKYKRKELIGKSLYDIYTDPKEREELLRVILDKGKIVNFEVHLTDKNGSQHSVELNTTLHRDQKGNPRKLIGSMRDISERKRLEARLLQSEKMEAVGTLAGGIAHEFNTLMTTVMGNADLALMSTGKDDPLREGLEDIKSAGERAADLTRQILAFSRKQMRQPKIQDLNEVLVNSEKTLKRLITGNVELKTIFESSLRTVNMDTTQIEQMVVNLVTNARDAMPTGGTLTIETANVDLDEDFFKDLAEEEQPGSYVMLSVTDTGSGMDAKTQEHMFDPFYTTGEVGKGAGLGLSMVYGIVKQNEGVIRVDSEIGRGSTFKIYLPIAKDDPEAEKTDLTREDAPKGSEEIDT